MRKGRWRGGSWLFAAGGEALFCVLYLMGMANVYKNQSSGAGGGGWEGIVPGGGHGQHFASIIFFFLL